MEKDIELIRECYDLIGKLNINREGLITCLNDPAYIDLFLLKKIYTNSPKDYKDKIYDDLKKKMYGKYHTLYETIVDEINGTRFQNMSSNEKKQKCRKDTSIMRIQIGVLSLINHFFQTKTNFMVTMRTRVIKDSNGNYISGIFIRENKPIISLMLSDFYNKHLNYDFDLNIESDEKSINIMLVKPKNVIELVHKPLYLYQYDKKRHHILTPTSVQKRVRKTKVSHEPKRYLSDKRLKDETKNEALKNIPTTIKYILDKKLKRMAEYRSKHVNE